MSPRFSIDPAEASGPFVVGLDVGSGGSRAALYDASGQEVGRRHHKVEHTFTTAADGTSTIDADQVVEEIGTALLAILEGTDIEVSAIGVDTFASSLVVVDEAGRAITPCITYADTRCRDQAAQLRELIGGPEELAAMHDRTGTRVHSSYLAPHLMWLAQEHPEVRARAARFMALGEYVAAQLLGQPALGTAAAAWGGMLDRRTGTYVPELVELAGIDIDQLGTPRSPSETIPVAGTPLARDVPQLASAVWVPVIGDGLAANLGIGAQGDGNWGVSTATSGAIRVLLGTSVEHLPQALWAYRVDDRRTLVGSAMSDCGRVLDYVTQTFSLPAELAALDTESLLLADPVASTPLVVPFLSGERGTGWRDSARAVFAGVSAATTPEEILRGSLEGVALSYLRIADALAEVAGRPERIMVSGGMTRVVPAWLQILADALDAPLDHVAISRSTLRGSAVLALEQVPGADIASAPVTRRIEPVPGRAAWYRERLERFEQFAALA